MLHICQMRIALFFGWMVLIVLTSCQETPKQQPPNPLNAPSLASPDTLNYDEARRRHESGDLIGAMAGYDQILKQNPDHVGALGNRAILLEGRGEVAAALLDYNHLLDLDSTNVPALVHRAALRARSGQHQAAIADFNSLLRLRPQDALIINDRGFAHYNMQNYELALSDFELALSLAPKLSPARINRGNTLYVMGRFSEAKEEFETVLTREPENVDALLALGKYWLFTENELDSAGKYYDRALQSPQSENPIAKAEAHLGKGNLLFMKRAFPDAIAEFGKGLQLQPNHLELNMNRGLANYNLQRYDDAIADYDQALKIQPGFASALAMRGYAKCESGMSSSGCIDLRAAMKKGESGVKEAIVKYCR